MSMTLPLSPYKLSAKTHLIFNPNALSSWGISLANCGLVLEMSPGFRHALGGKILNNNG
jgi:hypothetical protein